MRPSKRTPLLRARRTRPGGHDEGARAPEGKTAHRMVRVTYLDHVEFKECGDPDHVRPPECVTVGFLDEETSEYVRVLWLVEDVETATFQGMVIVRSCILKMEDLTLAEPPEEAGGGET